MHETILEHEIRVGSDRQFGLVFAAFFFLLGVYPALKTGPNAGCLAISGLFLLITLVYPRALHPLNVLWHRFGLLLAIFTQPIILGALFFLVLTLHRLALSVDLTLMRMEIPLENFPSLIT